MCTAKHCDGGHRCEDHRALRAKKLPQIVPAALDGVPALDWAEKPENEPERLYESFDRRTAAAAIRRAETSAEREPVITGDLLAATQASGAGLAGLEFRMKAPESLARKIQTKQDADPTQTHAEIAGDLNDVVRYTVTCPDAASTASQVEQVSGRLADRGWKLRELEHSHLPDNPYRGVHAVYEHPSGETVEVQFHTKQSLQVKESTHLAYETYRNPDCSPEEQAAARRASAEAWNTLPIPPGLDNLTVLGHTVVIKDYRGRSGRS